jgi:hypothetical protein
MGGNYALIINDLTSKGVEGKSGELEVLHAEGDADDGDAQQEPDTQVAQADPDAAAQQPDHVEDNGQAAGVVPGLPRGATERPQGQHTQLHRLQPERDADDGDHQQQAADKIFHCNEDAAEQQPDDVSKTAHG